MKEAKKVEFFHIAIENSRGMDSKGGGSKLQTVNRIALNKKRQAGREHTDGLALTHWEVVAPLGHRFPMGKYNQRDLEKQALPRAFFMHRLPLKKVTIIMN